ncbi:uncharacterized protein LOC8052506 [Ixodes scapularis]|uniref:uncharacterized protein LOC8052506 n=1 Tax=Ixodes scapularis TaxID=6945 RepID=UPI001C386F39|nr:uncharacterized protein LOC8052506 [Ixodes scapularis]
MTFDGQPKGSQQLVGVGALDNARNRFRQLGRQTVASWKSQETSHNVVKIAMQICIVVVLAVCGIAGTTALLRRSERAIQPLCENDVGQQHRLDRLVERIREKLRADEPFHLPSQLGPMRLTDGVLWGLSSFELRHPPQLVCGDDHANMTMLMGLIKPHVRYRWSFVPFRGVTGQLIAHSERATVDVLLRTPLSPPDAKARVESLKVTELSQIWVKVPSVPVVSWIASQIGNLGTMINRNQLKMFLQDNLRRSIQNTLDKEPL